MNILTIEYMEARAGKQRRQPLEIETAALTAEEFAYLRFLVDRTGIMSGGCGSAAVQTKGRSDITIRIRTVNGVHEAVFDGSALSEDEEDLTQHIRELLRVHGYARAS